MSGVLWTVYLTHFVTHSKDFASWKGFHVDEESIPQFLVWSNIIDLARAKSEALDNIYSLFKQNIKSCDAKRRKQLRTTVKNSNTSNYAKKAALHVQDTFFVHFFAVVLHDYNVKLPETSWLHVLWRKCRTCSVYIFSLPLIFTLHWRPLAFLILSPPLQNIQVVLPTKKCLQLHLGCHTCCLSYFTLVCLWCGRTVSRAGGRCTVTWLPNFRGWVDYFIFLPMVLRRRSSRTRALLKGLTVWVTVTFPWVISSLFNVISWR